MNKFFVSKKLILIGTLIAFSVACQPGSFDKMETRAKQTARKSTGGKAPKKAPTSPGKKSSGRVGANMENEDE